MGGVVAVREDPAVDHRMQGDHPVPEHVAEPGEFRGGGDLEAGLRDHLGRAAGADQLPAQIAQSRGELHDS